MEKDQKIANAAKFIVQREDHTLGNVLKEKILKQRQVSFCGYRVPHPLEPFFELVIHTSPKSSYTPLHALETALAELVDDIEKLKKNFEVFIFVLFHFTRVD